eukprot:2224415-Rhodomonas_salina.2
MTVGRTRLPGKKALDHLELLEGFGVNPKQKNLDGLQPRKVLEAGVGRGYMWGREGHGEDLTAADEEGEEGGSEAKSSVKEDGSSGMTEEGKEGGEGDGLRKRREEESRRVRQLLAAVGITDTSAAYKRT